MINFQTYEMIFSSTVQLQSTEIFEPLTPLVQVSGLLQSRKTKEDVQSIVDLCSTLSTAQVMKILKSYREDDYEAAMESEFIEKLTTKLNERITMVNFQYFFVILSEYFNGIFPFCTGLKRRIHNRRRISSSIQSCL